MGTYIVSTWGLYEKTIDIFTGRVEIHKSCYLFRTETLLLSVLIREVNRLAVEIDSTTAKVSLSILI